MTSSEQWRYVSTEDNPADFVSRGMDSLKLKTCELWWNSPKFLVSNQYPQQQIPVALIKDPGTRGSEWIERSCPHAQNPCGLHRQKPYATDSAPQC
ncbi:hypothetical protein TNCV_460641 [Trichonephila clavipes]|nr:hypothetical protein TNCV_460641 [Trichonephila clavipes]